MPLLVFVSIFIPSNSADSLVWRLQLPIVKRVQARLYAFISVACLTNCNTIDASFGLSFYVYSVCVLCGSPVWPSPPVVGPLRGHPLCVGPLWVSGVFSSHAISILILSNSAGSLLWWLQLPIVKRVQQRLYAFTSVACLTNLTSKMDASFGLSLHFYPLKLRGFARLEATASNRQTRAGRPLPQINPCVC